MDTLTLGQREQITGRVILQDDGDGTPAYCGDCLADLPRDPDIQKAHRCGETTRTWKVVDQDGNAQHYIDHLDGRFPGTRAERDACRCLLRLASLGVRGGLFLNGTLIAGEDLSAQRQPD